MEVCLPQDYVSLIGTVLQWQVATLHSQETEDPGYQDAYDAVFAPRKKPPARQESGRRAEAGCEHEIDVFVEIPDDSVPFIVAALDEKDKFTHGTKWQDGRYGIAAETLYRAYDSRLTAFGRKPIARQEIDPVLYNQHG